MSSLSPDPRPTIEILYRVSRTVCGKNWTCKLMTAYMYMYIHICTKYGYVVAGAYRAREVGEGACNAYIIMYTDRNPNMAAGLYLEISL